MASRIVSAALLALALGTAPVAAAPSAQLTTSVAQRLSNFGIRVDPEELTTAQASALHILLVSERGYVNVRRRAEAILRNPDYRD
ncbi:hypothetical protein LX81_00045 [Palleronia aestuarii]|uniref:Uncharacterized protein n=1 Tax=Palleronia aestuarii TaxID=568105 RepID=A0A2W7QCN6_9RHOB|nr:hypothetical protein [Palleronia aestuarii]PZX19589.1 hypothetical protein LX81_00045 [Palleronia aestuarii]